MLNVGNQKAVRNLANQSFRANRWRNVVASIAIALTAVLFTTLFTMGSGVMESFQRQTMRQSGSSAHAVFKNLTREQFDKLRTHPLARDMADCVLCADKVENPAFLKRRVEMWYYPADRYAWYFIEPAAGRIPQAADEIMMDKKSLELLGIPAQPGEKVTLQLRIRPQDGVIARTFTLSGYFDQEMVANVGFALVSQAYLDAHAEELIYTYDKDFCNTGAIRGDVMFDNTANMQEKLDQMIVESGYSTDPDAPDYIASNENWAYLSTSVGGDITTMLALAGGLLLILLTGYLIIYNIFQISVIRDIRFYGLLKTIGTTGKQLRRILRRQALLLSAIGIPIGLLVGFFIGKMLVPSLMQHLQYGAADMSVSANLWIFIGSAVFALLTVWISVGRPARVASRVSPVEAVRYTDGGQVHSKKMRNTKKGGRLQNMARANLGRNKRRTVLVVLSLSLSLVLLNVVFTVSQSFDLNKYLAKFVDLDFEIAHADYYNFDFRGSENALSEDLIKGVQAQPGFENGARVWHNMDEEVFYMVDPKYDKDYNCDPETGEPLVSTYGLDALLLQNMEVVAGEIDLEKLQTGNFVLAGVMVDDQGNPAQGPWDRWNVGDKVTLYHYKGRLSSQDGMQQPGEKTAREFTVMAKVKQRYTDGTAWGDGYTFYLPSAVYCSMTARPGLMSYHFNVSDDKEDAMNAYLAEVTETEEPLMAFQSKQKYITEFHSLRSTVLIVGGLLSFIIALIGVLNFINGVLTSIITRRREFAMLQSIGMTGRQLRRLLVYEGLYYAAGTIALSLLLGVLSSYTVVGSLIGGMWFMSYRFIIWPLLAIFPLLLALGALVPLAAQRFTGKQPIVERLRENE